LMMMLMLLRWLWWQRRQGAVAQLQPADGEHPRLALRPGRCTRVRRDGRCGCLGLCLSLKLLVLRASWLRISLDHNLLEGTIPSAFLAYARARAAPHVVACD
jgi:hypothetical protein